VSNRSTSELNFIDGFRSIPLTWIIWYIREDMMH
jgi:hypothetical protein